MLNMLKALIIKLLGGLNTESLNAIFQLSGTNLKVEDLKKAAIEKLNADELAAKGEIATAEAEAKAAEETCQATTSEALTIYTKTVNAATETKNKKVAASNKTKQAAAGKVQTIATQRKLIG